MTVYKRWTQEGVGWRPMRIEAGPLDWATFWLAAGGLGGLLGALWLGWI